MLNVIIGSFPHRLFLMIVVFTRFYHYKMTFTERIVRMMRVYWVYIYICTSGYIVDHLVMIIWPWHWLKFSIADTSIETSTLKWHAITKDITYIALIEHFVKKNISFYLFAASGCEKKIFFFKYKRTFWNILEKCNARNLDPFQKPVKNSCIFWIIPFNTNYWIHLWYIWFIDSSRIFSLHRGKKISKFL